MSNSSAIPNNNRYLVQAKDLPGWAQAQSAAAVFGGGEPVTTPETHAGPCVFPVFYAIFMDIVMNKISDMFGTGHLQVDEVHDGQLFFLLIKRTPLDFHVQIVAWNTRNVSLKFG